MYTYIDTGSALSMQHREDEATTDRTAIGAQHCNQSLSSDHLKSTPGPHVHVHVNVVRITSTNESVLTAP